MGPMLPRFAKGLYRNEEEKHGNRRDFPVMEHGMGKPPVCPHFFQIKRRKRR